MCTDSTSSGAAYTVDEVLVSGDSPRRIDLLARLLSRVTTDGALGSSSGGQIGIALVLRLISSVSEFFLLRPVTVVRFFTSLSSARLWGHE